MKSHIRHAVPLLQTRIVFQVNILVQNAASADVIYPAVQEQFLLIVPGILNDGSLRKVIDLFLNIQLYEPVPPCLLIGNAVELFLVEAINIFDVADPVVDDTN